MSMYLHFESNCSYTPRATLSISFSLCTLLLTFSLAFHVICTAGAGTTYIVKNHDPDHPGGVKFEKIIGGAAETKRIAAQIENFIYSTIFKQDNPADRRKHDQVEIVIMPYIGAAAMTTGNVVNVSAVYLDGYQGDLKWEYISLLHHELTHVFQWLGGPKNPASVIEGIADYTMLKANYYPEGAAKPGSGDRWDQGYDFTAQFLSYVDSLVPDFVVKLNKMMKDDWDVSFIKNITGKPVEQLWKDYKAKYGQKCD